MKRRMKEQLEKVLKTVLTMAEFDWLYERYYSVVRNPENNEMLRYLKLDLEQIRFARRYV